VTIPREGRVATLWNLILHDDRVSCVVYHGVKGMELRLESATAVILTEPFEMQPRAFARMKALRESLKRRGWLEENPKSQNPNSKSQ
jgi:hypothetical protein